jgi:uncharacterized protein (DUF1501 family)
MHNADTSRRSFVKAMLSAGALAPWSTLTLADTARRDGNRFVLVILRGGLDGLSAVPAVGDADFAAARGPLGQFPTPALPIDGTFALHPQLSQLHAMVRNREALVVHAVGLPYRERSHFDAQQLLESGGTKPYQLTTGWLGRALAASSQRGIAINTAVPLVLRGPAVVDTWAPSALADPSADLVARLERLYTQDAALGQALARAKRLRSENGMLTEMAPGDGAKRGGIVALARKAGEFLAQANGPQAAVLEMGGFDTHANQAAPNGVLANNLRLLDAGLAALRDSLGAQWSRTVAVVLTEFGREVAVNGTQGTDHGTGGAAFVLGGPVQGGRVVADWPGLAPHDRYEGRDLRITTDVRALLKGVLGDHLHVAVAALHREVFPGSEAAAPLRLFG